MEQKKEECIDEDVQLLKENRLKIVKDWKKLTEEQKGTAKFPLGLRTILDEHSGINKFQDTKEGTEFLKKFIKITSLKQVQEEVKAKFEFIEREEGKKEVENCALNNLDSYSKAIQEPTKSQDVGFIIVSGGSGSGKTRATKEMLGIVKTLSEISVFQNTCSIYFDFKNGDTLLPFENDTMQIAGLRIFSHGLCLSTVKDIPLELRQRLEELHKLEVFEVSNILGLIGEIYHQLLGFNELIPLIIIMDEMQLTISHFLNPKEYKKISISLGQYFSQKKKNLEKDKLVIIPVISGTDINLKFPLTEFKNFQFPLPPFSQEGIFKIIEQQKIDKFWYDNKEKRRFWHLNGMIPRCLEFGIDAIKKLNRNQFTSEELLFQKLEEMISLNYGKLDTLLKKELLYLCLSGLFSQSIYDSDWFNRLYLKGIIYLDPKSNKLLLPYPYFQNIMKYDISGIPSNIFPNLTSQFNWILFEQLIDYILYHKMIGKRYIESKYNIEITELFWGAHMSDSIRDLYLNISMLELENAKAPFLKGTKKKYYLNSWSKKERKTLISNCKKNNLLNDSTITDEVNKNLLIIQKKYISDPSQDSEDQLKTGYPDLWFDEISKIENFKEFVGYEKIYVFITNANIPKKAKEVIRKRRNAIIIDQSVSSSFFSPNLLPYVTSVVK